MRHEKPDHVQPVAAPELPEGFKNIHLRDVATPARLQALVSMLAAIVVRTCTTEDAEMVESPQTHQRAA